MIDIQQLSKSYGKIKVLNQIQLSFSKGETIALIGPNGSGKTTLIKCLLGMVHPDEGDIRMNGSSIIGNSNYKKQIGYMPQISRLPENLSIHQLMQLIMQLRSTEKDYDKELETQFGLTNISEKRFGSLSGGTKQKVSAVIAFLFKPQLLVLDEPTAGLDPISTEHLKLKIKQSHQQGRTTLITTHHMTEVQELATRVIYISEGNILFDKSPDEIQQLTGQQNLNSAVAKMLAS